MSNVNYNVGDKVFAKMRGYRPWPARVENIISDNVEIRYKVSFYGDGSTGVLKAAQMCSFVENKMRLGKCEKQNSKFSEAMRQIETALSPKELKVLKKLESRKELGFSNLNLSEAPQSSAGNAETSLSGEGVSELDSSLPKKTKVDNSPTQKTELDNSPTQKTELDNSFPTENSPLDPESEKASERIDDSESVSESVETQDEEERCQEPPTLHSFTESTDDMVHPLAYINTDYTVRYNGRSYNIPIHINKPAFHTLKDETIWYANMVQYASYIKQKVEAGDIPPDSIDSYMVERSLAIVKLYQEHCNIKNADATTQFILTEEKLISLNYSLRKAVADTTPSNLDVQLGICVPILNSLADIKLTRLLLVRNPDFVLNIKFARESFLTTFKDKEMEHQINRKIKAFCSRIEQIYSIFITFFSVPSSMNFWQVYDLERSAYEVEKENNSLEELVAEDLLYFNR